MKAIRILTATGLIAMSAVCCTKEDNPGVPDPYPVKPASYTIMSFNLRNSAMNDKGEKSWDSRKTAVAAMFRDIRPDIAGIQEASTAQRNDLVRMLPEYGMMEIPGTGTSKGGNTIMLYDTTRFAPERYQSFYLSDTPYIASVNGWNEETQYRTTIWARMKDLQTGNVFFVADTHLPLYNTVTGIKARKNSAALNNTLLKEIAGEKNILFLVGDMNCSDAQSGLEPFYEWFKAAREDAPVTSTVPTYNAFGEGAQTMLDHIFYRNAIADEFKTVTSANYGVKYISDHYPVVCKFSVR